MYSLYRVPSIVLSYVINNNNIYNNHTIIIMVVVVFILLFLILFLIFFIIIILMLENIAVVSTCRPTPATAAGSTEPYSCTGYRPWSLATVRP